VASVGVIYLTQSHINDAGQTQENPGGMRHDLIAQTNFRKAVSLNQITGKIILARHDYAL
jgi:hypothetical protein